jgi:mRNA deadenylase 3'-5' endonuclease subunit Ccr4
MEKTVAKVLKEIDEEDYVPLDVVIDRSRVLDEKFGEDSESLLETLKETNAHKRMFTFNEEDLEVKLLSFEETIARQIDEFFEEMPDKLKNAMERNEDWVTVDFMSNFSKMNTLLQKVEDRISVIKNAVKDHSRIAQLDSNEEKIRKLAPAERLRKQIEKLFLDDNYYTDEFLLELASQNDGRYIPLSTLLSLPSVKKETTSEKDIINSLNESALVEINDDKTAVRKKFVLPPAGSKKLPKPLEERIVKLVDLYFGEGSYLYDRNMHDLENQNSGGIPLKSVIEFPRLSMLLDGADITEEQIASAISKSSVNSILEVTNLRRKNEYCPRKAVVKEDLREKYADFQFNEHSDDDFSIMTYNILADFLCEAGGYRYASKRSKKWKNRFRVITDQIRYYSPDILCVQELQGTLNSNIEDPDDHYTQLVEKLKEMGYSKEAVYMRKTVHNVGEQKRGPDIGNAIFYKEDVFELKNKKEISYAEVLSEHCAQDETTKHQIAKMYPQVAVIAHLKHKKTEKELIVCTTHLSANFNAAYIQLMQLQMCVDALCEFISSIQVPVIFCGDFNSTPEHPNYDMISTGALTNEKKAQVLNAARKDEFFVPSNTPFKCDLKLKSAYKQVLGKEPKATHVVETFHGTLDYVWYSELLQPIAVLDAPTVENMKREMGIPDSANPSDHVPLLVKFSFT